MPSATSILQIATALGAEVTAVCSTSNVATVRKLGAGRVIDYTKEDFAKESTQYDIVFDVVGKVPLSGAIARVKKGGAYCQAVPAPSKMLRLVFATIRAGVRIVG